MAPPRPRRDVPPRVPRPHPRPHLLRDVRPAPRPRRAVHGTRHRLGRTHPVDPCPVRVADQRATSPSAGWRVFVVGSGQECGAHLPVALCRCIPCGMCESGKSARPRDAGHARRGAARIAHVLTHRHLRRAFRSGHGRDPSRALHSGLGHDPPTPVSVAPSHLSSTTQAVAAAIERVAAPSPVHGPILSAAAVSQWEHDHSDR